MLLGANDLSDNGAFVVTREQVAMLAEYRQENSSVEGFIAECVEVDTTAEVVGRDLYDEYKAYCQKDGRKFKGNIVFTKEMRAYGTRYGSFGYEERSSGHGVSRFIGIKIQNEWSKERKAIIDFRDF